MYLSSIGVCSTNHVTCVSTRDIWGLKKRYVDLGDSSYVTNLIWIDRDQDGHGDWLAEQLKPYGIVTKGKGFSCAAHQFCDLGFFSFSPHLDKKANSRLRDIWKKEIEEHNKENTKGANAEAYGNLLVNPATTVNKVKTLREMLNGNYKFSQARVPYQYDPAFNRRRVMNQTFNRDLKGRFIPMPKNIVRKYAI